MIIDYLPLIAGILSIALGIVVLVSGTNRKNIRWPFILFALSVGVWAIFISLFRLTDDSNLARIFVDIYYIAALFIAYSFLLFGLYYSSIKISKITIVFALLPLIAMAVMIAVSKLIIGSVNAVGQASVSLEQPGYLLYSLLFITYVAIVLSVLWQKAMKRNSGMIHRRILAVSLTICLLGGGYFNLILPWMGDYSYISLGPLFTFLMVASVFYVIAQHGLFDIRLAVIRTVTYLLSLVTLAGVYLLIAFVVFNQLLGQTSSVGQTVLNVFLTLVLAFLFQPVKKFFDQLTNKLFYKDVYNADDFYVRLNKVLTSTTDLRTLLKRAASVIAETLKGEQVSFVLYVGERGLFSAGTEGYVKLPYKDVRDLEDEEGIIVAQSSAIPRHIHRILVSHRIAIAMPINRDGVLLGYLCLGEHRTSNYTRRDLKVLQTIADELVIAIQNALSVQEVKDLNANLEQRIDAATKELRASNAQLQRLDEAKDEFISMASHQLRTPLTSIKGYVSMLMEGDVGKVTPDQKHLLEEAFMSSERMVRLIGDFLNVSRLQTGKFMIDKHPTDLSKVVQHELEALETNANSRNLKFTYIKPKAFPILNLDESKIQQVIMNFADNAIYYSKENTTIKVTLKADEKGIEFTVKDTGIGVPESEKDKLFNKFFRATNARKQRPDGTGVGLFLAKKVIDAHDGKVIFESKEKKGSTFGFRLPLSKNR